MGFERDKATRPPVKYDPALHHRRSIRLRGHDYAGRGVYFVTLQTSDFRPLFGTVVGERMALNDAGRAAAACWRAIPEHFPHAALDEWIIMPDHVHGIIVIRRDGHPPVGAKNISPEPGRANGCSPGDKRANDYSPLRPRGTSRTIGSIVRGFKIGVTKSLGGASAWQRNYYDIIVRDRRALNNIRAYIRNNPANWNVHRYGKPRFFAGNRALLDLPMTAFLASRGDGNGTHDGNGKWQTLCDPMRWPDQPVCVVSGFLSPMERRVFDACLGRNIPIVWIMARGIPVRLPPYLQHAIDNGRLFAISPFDPAIDRFSAARAAWCNQYALHLASRAVIGQFTPDGMLACLLADLQHDISVCYLDPGAAKAVGTQ